MKRKAKTMAKILEEFSDALFDGHGNLHAGTAILYNASFNELGGFVDDALWCEQFLEPLPEKKEKRLYAYRGGIEVKLFTMDELDARSSDGFKYQRDPDWDIIYPVPDPTQNE